MGGGRAVLLADVSVVGIQETYKNIYTTHTHTHSCIIVYLKAENMGGEGEIKLGRLAVLRAQRQI